jgi:hypothetical protein
MKDDYEISLNTKTAEGKWEFVFHNSHGFEITADITEAAENGPQTTPVRIPPKSAVKYEPKGPNIRCRFRNSANAGLTPRFGPDGHVCFDKY